MNNTIDLYKKLATLAKTGEDSQYTSPASGYVSSYFKEDIETIKELSPKKLESVIQEVSRGDYKKTSYLINSIVDAISVSYRTSTPIKSVSTEEDLPDRLQAKALVYSQNNDKKSIISLEKRMSI